LLRQDGAAAQQDELGESRMRQADAMVFLLNGFIVIVSSTTG
jgi:hypothetical protein